MLLLGIVRHATLRHRHAVEYLDGVLAIKVQLIESSL